MVFNKFKRCRYICGAAAAAASISILTSVHPAQAASHSKAAQNVTLRGLSGLQQGELTAVQALKLTAQQNGFSSVKELKTSKILSYDDDRKDDKKSVQKKDKHQKKESSAKKSRADEKSSSISSRIAAILEKDDTAGVFEPIYNPGYDFENLGADSIMGTAVASQEQCVRYLMQMNPHPKISVSPEELVKYYYEEAGREGIRPDAAFAQALKETGNFNYGGTVTPDQNNYCGLGTTSATIKGAYFDTAQLGVRAHIQHLLAYTSVRLPREDIVDPRYSLVRSAYAGSTIDTWQGLNGRWAVPGNNYGQEILQILNRIKHE